MSYQLQQHAGRTVLIDPDTNEKPIAVDFLGGHSDHRRRYGGGKGQLIAKAVGVKRYGAPSVLDVTAGLGEDGFVLACLGCRVLMLERDPIIAALLSDGLQRFHDDPESGGIQLAFQAVDALIYLQALARDARPDVIYMDPMFPQSDKTAAVKKAMRALRSIVGDDSDASAVFELALKRAKKRVVVKRPRYAPTLTTAAPDSVYRGQSGRFDVYLLS